MSDELIRVTGLGRDYGSGDRVVHAVRDVTFTAGRGELVAVRGRSGAGKTTLLNMIGGLDQPTRGRVEVAGHDVTAAGEAELLELRRTTIGFVFQSFGLIPILSAAENVSVPLRLNRRSAADRTERVALLLELVGLGGQAEPGPGQRPVAADRRRADRPARLGDRPLHHGPAARPGRRARHDGPGGDPRRVADRPRRPGADPARRPPGLNLPPGEAAEWGHGIPVDR
jgi:putative ABC transport system ATP-binding protein